MVNAKGSDRAHKIPDGSLINATLGPVYDFTILRFGLGMERDDAPALWASKVNRLLGYWLPTPAHSGADQANEFADAMAAYDVIGWALDYESVNGVAPPTPAQVAEFRTTMKNRRPDLPGGFYGTRYTTPPEVGVFDWIWIAGDPGTAHYDMRQTVVAGVDTDTWQGDLASFEAFFGGEMATYGDSDVLSLFGIGSADTAKEVADNALGLGDAVDDEAEKDARRAQIFAAIRPLIEAGPGGGGSVTLPVGAVLEVVGTPDGSVQLQVVSLP